MKYFILMALACNLLLPNPIVLAKKLQNQDISLYYYYWKNDNNEYYLGKKRNDGKYSVWLYTKERKWKPFHNADAFDGFSKAGKVYKSVSFKDGNIMLEMKDGSGDDNDSGDDAGDNDSPPSSGPPLPFSINELAEETNIKTYKVAYYFWLNKSGMAFLSRVNEKTNTISIWNYTSKRKWMPLHNAKTFDGFSPIGKTFESAKIDSALSKINITKFINPFKEDFDLKIYSNSVGDNNSLTSEFLTMTPQFSWTYDDKYKTVNEAFILQITKKDGTLVYSALLPKDTSSIKQGRGKDGVVLALPMNSFCDKSYTNVNNNNDDKIDYEASIYAVYDTSIFNKDTCTKDIMDEENYLAKGSMNISLFTNSTVKTKSNLSYNKDEKYIQGTVSFTFKDVKLKASIQNIKSHINITNLPKKFSISKDLNINHKIVDDNKLNITVEKTNITLDKKNITVEFLDTLFQESPKKVQKASVDIGDYKAPEALPLPGLP